MILTTLLLVQFATAAPIEFVGSTPCDAAPRRFLSIGAAAPCERISWELRLSEGRPAQFTLRAVYGMTVPNTEGLERGGTAITIAGTWSVGGDRSDGDAVYRLALDGAAGSMQFRRIGQNLLHPLDSRGGLLRGNAGWSYTLNRVNPVAAKTGNRRLESGATTSLPGSQVFEGRTPCREIAAQLAQSVPSDCFKLKWKVTLRSDAATGVPAGYVLEGTWYRDAPRKGRWVTTTSAADGAWSIYRLDEVTPGRSLSLYRAGEDVLLVVDEAGSVLVGNNLYSYTLNRRR